MRKNTTQPCVFHRLYYYLIRITIVIQSCSIQAQVFDDFSDGNMSVNPQWTGDTSDFKVSTSSAIPPSMKPAIQLNGVNADTSSIVVNNDFVINTQWRFWVKHSFNSSANNLTRIYLVSDNDNLEMPLNGYFIQVGGSEDSVLLYRQNGTMVEPLIKSQTAYTGNSTNILRLKVTRDQIGYWKLFSDPAGGYDFIEEGSAFDDTWINTSYFGVFCRYTSSNSTKFYFDDFYVNDIYSDTVPPQVIAVDPLSANELRVVFSEPLLPINAQDTANYEVNNQIGKPSSVTFENDDNKIITLIFGNTFSPDVNYILNVSGIIDIAGNIVLNSMTEFQFVQQPYIAFGDLMINELMVDVNPVPDALPEADYLELYNRLPFEINLKNFSIQTKLTSEPLIFPEVFILPDSFLIIVNPSHFEEFTTYGQAYGLTGFSLNNESTVILRNKSGNIIHAIEYTQEWYRDSDKAEGGWAIEQIDPGNPCSGENNWRASVAEEGGTPGNTNSVIGYTYSIPEISGMYVESEKVVLLFFSHSMDSSGLVSPDKYFVNKGIGIPSEIILNDNLFSSISLTFDNTLAENSVYQLQLYDTLYDCSGQYIPEAYKFSFVRPGKPDPFDIVINEIMSDPTPPWGLPEFEYIELLNISDKYLDLTDWTLIVGSVDKEVPGLIVSPGEFILFTEDEGAAIFSMFGKTIGFSSLGLSNSGTELYLRDSHDLLISYVSYSKDWITDEDKYDGGYSLEQIDPYSPCNIMNNWQVTNSDQGGTPGEVNSVDSENYQDLTIQKAIVVDHKQLKIRFNQIMDRSVLEDINSFYVDRGIGNPILIRPADSTFRNLTLHFDNQFIKGNIYLLSVEEPLKNCTGDDLITTGSISFGPEEAPASNDVIINEVLFNPAGDGADFIEIYNRSDKVINVYDLKLGNIENDVFGNPDTALKSIVDEDFLILPENFMVLSRNPYVVMEQYYYENSDCFLRTNALPLLNNTTGNIYIGSLGGTMIDLMQYNESMHHPMLKVLEGVSLERISYDNSSIDPGNWHSASSAVGYATPGYRNSQYVASIKGNVTFMVDPEIFSPNNDGFDDVVKFRYNFNETGNLASLTIHDASGRLIRVIANNEILGTEGSFTWNGNTDENHKVKTGIYIVFLEVFDLEGRINKYKRTVVVAGGME